MFSVQCSGFRVQGPGFRVQASGFRVQGSGFRVQISGFRFQGSEFRVQGSGFRVHFRVQGAAERSSLSAIPGCGSGIEGWGLGLSRAELVEVSEVRVWRCSHHGGHEQAF